MSWFTERDAWTKGYDDCFYNRPWAPGNCHHTSVEYAKYQRGWAAGRKARVAAHP